MVYELAHIEILPGKQEPFEAAVRKAAPLFQTFKGCRGMQIKHVIESPTQYLLVVEWDTLETHTVEFRGSENFKGWRALVGEFFAKPPEVVHATTAKFF